MIAFTALALVLLLAAGFAVLQRFVADMSAPTTNASIPTVSSTGIRHSIQPSIGGVLILFISIGVFQQLPRWFPATDTFNDANIPLEILVWPHNDLSGPPHARILVSYPPKTTDGSDFQVMLTLRPVELSTIMVKTRFPDVWQARSFNTCTEPGSDSWCASQNGGAYKFNWNVSGKRTGIFFTDILLPKIWMGPETVISQSIRQNNFDTKQVFRLDESAPVQKTSTAVFDANTGVLTLKTNVVRSLGLNERDYLTLGIVGTVLSTALGSGWLFKVIDIVRKSARASRRSNRMVDVVYAPPGFRPTDSQAFYVRMDSTGLKAMTATLAGLEGAQYHPIVGDFQGAVDRAVEMARDAGFPKVYVLSR